MKVVQTWWPKAQSPDPKFPEDICCYCMEPATETVPVDIGETTLQVPYCTEHARLARECAGISPQYGTTIPTLVGYVVGIPIGLSIYSMWGSDSLLDVVTHAVIAFQVGLIAMRVVRGILNYLSLTRAEQREFSRIGLPEEAVVRYKMSGQQEDQYGLGTGAAQGATKSKGVLLMKSIAFRFTNDEYAEMFEAAQVPETLSPPESE